MTNNKNTSRLLRYFCIALFILVSPSSVYSAVDSWSLNTPQGGVVQALAVDPNNANVLFAGTTANGIYKSIDGGENWTPSSTGLNTLNILTLAFDNVLVDGSPVTRIYAGTNGGGIYRSLDNGDTWEGVNTNLLNLDVYDMAFHPTDNNTMYAATFGNVFSSSERAFTSIVWDRQGVGAGLTSNAFQTVLADPNNPDSIYVGTFSGGVFASADSGINWVAVNNGLTTFNVRHLSASTTGNLYAGTQGGGFFVGVPTTPTNITWSASNTGLANTTVNDVVESRSNPSVLYAATHNNVYRSTDSGSTWSAVGVDLSGLRIITLAIDHNTTPETIYAGTHQGVYKVEDGTSTWREVNNGISAHHITDLAIDSINPNLQYASTLGSGVLKTTDAGTTWLYTNAGISDLKALAIAVDGSNVYVGTQFSGTYKSIDGGNNWTDAHDGLGSPLVTHIIDDSASSDRLYAATAAGINATNNGGGLWSSINADIAVQHDIRANTLAVDPANASNRRIYLSTASSGLFYSPTANIDWNNIALSTLSWTSISAGLSNEFIYALAIDPNNPDILYAGSRGSGMFKSIDRGASWFAINSGLKNDALANDIVHVNTIAINPNDSSLVYAGTETRGVFRSLDGGSTWAAVNNGLSETNIQVLKINPSTNTLYAGTKGGGIYSIDFSTTNTSALKADTTTKNKSGGTGSSNYFILLGFVVLLLATRTKFFPPRKLKPS